MYKLHVIAACLMALFATAPLSAGELEQRKAQMDEVRQHIVARDFDWLDQDARTLRLQRSRTQSGIWKLQLFYNAMWYLGQRKAPECVDPADQFLADWRAHSPNSPAPFIVSADRLLDTGWCVRGDGKASSVEDSAWEPFHKKADAAYQMLVRHKAVASQDPQYYSVMATIYVAQGRSPAELGALIAEGSKREPYYYGFYEEAFRYFEPQWYGSYDDEKALASLAVDRTRTNDRTSAFARIYWHAMECGCMPPADQLDQPRLKQAMNDLTALYPDAWNLSHMARMACMIGDAALAKQYFAALPNDDDGRSGWGEEGDRLQEWRVCRARAGLPANA